MNFMFTFGLPPKPEFTLVGTRTQKLWHPSIARGRAARALGGGDRRRTNYWRPRPLPCACASRPLPDAVGHLAGHCWRRGAWGPPPAASGHPHSTVLATVQAPAGLLLPPLRIRSLDGVSGPLFMSACLPARVSVCVRAPHSSPALLLWIWFESCRPAAACFASPRLAACAQRRGGTAFQSHAGTGGSPGASRPSGGGCRLALRLPQSIDLCAWRHHEQGCWAKGQRQSRAPFRLFPCGLFLVSCEPTTRVAHADADGNWPPEGHGCRRGDVCLPVEDGDAIDETVEAARSKLQTATPGVVFLAHTRVVVKTSPTPLAGYLFHVT